MPSETLITIIGNLIDNAFEAMNAAGDRFDRPRELLFGIYSAPGSLMIDVNDTGVGIRREDMDKVFLDGYSSKGEGRGTGLYQVKCMTENLGGQISIDSKYGVGTSVNVSFGK
jgi:sensor histidine kinase regulating citrate/malate metabolism